MAGSIYEFMARGEYAGSLIHSPNVYDFPVSLHLARALGGDALWVHNRQPVHFGETWLDDRANMIRLPGIVACSPWRATLDRLCELARDWSPVRYPPET
jgi:3'(2'), 5'-bisphosphate nucleotidase